MPWYEKGFFIIIDLPLNFLRDITIPACELKQWNRYFFSIFPLCATIFILLTSGNIGLFGKDIFLSIGILVGIIIICIILNQVTYRNRLPSQIIV